VSALRGLDSKLAPLAGVDRFRSQPIYTLENMVIGRGDFDRPAGLFGVSPSTPLRTWLSAVEILTGPPVLLTNVMVSPVDAFRIPGATTATGGKASILIVWFATVTSLGEVSQ
jgi:hypothetical protein